MLATLAKRVGVPPFRPHDLRHTAATICRESGVLPKDMCERFGWSDKSRVDSGEKAARLHPLPGTGNVCLVPAAAAVAP